MIYGKWQIGRWSDRFSMQTGRSVLRVNVREIKLVRENRKLRREIERLTKESTFYREEYERLTKESTFIEKNMKDSQQRISTFSWKRRH